MREGKGGRENALLSRRAQRKGGKQAAVWRNMGKPEGERKGISVVLKRERRKCRFVSYYGIADFIAEKGA